MPPASCDAETTKESIKSTNLEQEKDRQKEKVGGRPAKLNEIKGERDKKKGDIFLLEEQHDNFVAVVTK